MSNVQKRKSGDALILSGALSGTLPDGIDWSGATGELHIVDSSTLVEERSEACTITPPSGPDSARYTYLGGPIEVGRYLYEIQVTFAGLSDPLTFPNDNTKFKLKVYAELG